MPMKASKLGLRILYLEDEPLQREIASRWLDEEECSVRAVDNGGDAIRAVERETFDVMILDWEVPPPTGPEVLRWIRARERSTPVVFVTSRDAEADIMEMLRTGADDYFVKPLRRGEFLARMQALARRAGLGPTESSSIEAGAYRVDLASRTIFLEGEPVKLKPREAEVAIFLFRKRGQVVSRAEIYEAVWGQREALQTRTADVHVSAVRKALRLDGTHGWRLSSVYQLGYRLEDTRGGESRPS
jgi:DNA-binding response OmpR family regulator